jgi:hypothetical protein
MGKSPSDVCRIEVRKFGEIALSVGIAKIAHEPAGASGAALPFFKSGKPPDRFPVMTAVEIRDKDASDTKLLPALVDATAENFTLREVSADKGYGSLRNYKAIQYHGATPYIAFKSIHTGRGGGLWQRMFHLFHFHREDFLQHYHKPSNVESTFSMIKAKFRDHVRSKTPVAITRYASSPGSSRFGAQRDQGDTDRVLHHQVRRVDRIGD